MKTNKINVVLSLNKKVVSDYLNNWNEIVRASGGACGMGATVQGTTAFTTTQGTTAKTGRTANTTVDAGISYTGKPYGTTGNSNGCQNNCL